MVNKLLLTAFLIILFSFSLISAELIVGNTNTNNKIVELVTDIPINESTTSQVFNMSDLWVTNEGFMDNVPDLYPTLDTRYFTRTQILSFNYNSTFNQTYQNYAFLNQSNNSLFLEGFNWITNPYFNRWALDTNATTECNDGEYLDGDGNCYPITTSKTYNASSIVLEQGVHDGGDIASIQFVDDGDTYNISEEGGINSLRVNITFCDVEDIDFIAIHYWYDDGDHSLPIGLWDFVNGGFEFEYGSMPSTPTFHWYSHAVLDADTHINASGCAILQIDHDGTGISWHDLYLDAVFLQKGNQLTTVNSIFQLNDRDDPTAFDWAWDKAGSKVATGNWDLDGNNLSLGWTFPDKINWTYNHVNQTQFSFKDFILTIKESWLFNLFYTKTESNDNLNNNISAINTTSNIESLGFVQGEHSVNGTSINITAVETKNATIKDTLCFNLDCSSKIYETDSGSLKIVVA